MKKYVLSWMVCVGILLGTVVVMAETTIDPILAKVNEAEILQSDIDFIVTTFVEPQFQAQGQAMTAEQKADIGQKILEQLVLQQIVTQEAARLKIAVDEAMLNQQMDQVKQMKPDVDMARLTKLFTSEVAAQQVVQQEVVAKIAVADEEMQAYYEKNKEQYKEPEQVQASHILVTVKSDAPQADKDAARKKIDDLLAQVKGGKDFAEVAKANSDCPSKEQGGDLGFFGRGAMVQPFEDTAFAMKEGEISDVIETQFGYHIIKLTGRKPEHQSSFDEVKESIQQSLKNEKTQTEIGKWLDALRANAKIEMLTPTPAPAADVTPTPAPAK